MKMNKVFALLLALALCLSLAACGGGSEPAPAPAPAEPSSAAPAPEPAPEPEPEPEGEGEPAATDGDPYTNYPLLVENLKELYEVDPSTLAPSGWQFAGGYTNGKELNDQEAGEILAMYGGTLQLIFTSQETATMVQGGGNLEGSYTVLSDNFTINLALNLQGTTYNYVAVFTDLEGTPVLLLVATADPETVLYMTQIDEK